MIINLISSLKFNSLCTTIVLLCPFQCWRTLVNGWIQWYRSKVQLWGTVCIRRPSYIIRHLQHVRRRHCAQYCELLRSLVRQSSLQRSNLSTLLVRLQKTNFYHYHQGPKWLCHILEHSCSISLFLSVRVCLFFCASVLPWKIPGFIAVLTFWCLWPAIIGVLPHCPHIGWWYGKLSHFFMIIWNHLVTLQAFTFVNEDIRHVWPSRQVAFDSMYWHNRLCRYLMLI